MSELPRGVVLDCDGTIADTEPLSHRAATTVLARYGYEPDDADFTHVKGGAWPRTYAYWRERAPEVPEAPALRAEIRTVFRDLFDRELEIFEDAVRVIEELAGEGVPVGVASSSSHEHVERVLDRAGVSELVGAVVGADDVTAYKPDPEPYRRAAEVLGVDPSGCSAAEDTAIGIRAAGSAGMWVVGVARAGVDEPDLGEADVVVRALTVAALTRPRRGSPRR